MCIYSEITYKRLNNNADRCFKQKWISQYKWLRTAVTKLFQNFIISERAYEKQISSKYIEEIDRSLKWWWGKNGLRGLPHYRQWSSAGYNSYQENDSKFKVHKDQPMETLPTILLQDMTDRQSITFPAQYVGERRASGRLEVESITWRGRCNTSQRRPTWMLGCWLLLRLQLGFPIIVPAGHGDAGEAKRRQQDVAPEKGVQGGESEQRAWKMIIIWHCKIDQSAQIYNHLIVLLKRSHL